MSWQHCKACLQNAFETNASIFLSAGKLRSRSNDQDVRHSSHHHHTPNVQWRESSLDSRLPLTQNGKHMPPQSRPESPFKSSKGKKTFRSLSRPASPPCTCDDEEEEDEAPRPPRSRSRGAGHPMGHDLPSHGIPPWDHESRDSRLSRATTTRTAGFDSLASSAFQMPENVFIDSVDHRQGHEVMEGHHVQALASDAISLDALSPRPRSRSRTRSRIERSSALANTHVRHISEHDNGGVGVRGGLVGNGYRRRSNSRPPDYHYHHELDRCRSFRDGGLDDHIEFCKCTCDDRVTEYDEFIIESKVSPILHSKMNLCISNDVTSRRGCHWKLRTKASLDTF